MNSTPSIRGASILNSASRSRSGVGRVLKPGRVLSTLLRNSPAITRISAYLHQPVFPLPMLADIGNGAPQVLWRRRIPDKGLRFAARQLQQIHIANQVGDSQRRQTRLPRPKEFPRPPELHVHLGDVEAVVRFEHGTDALAAVVVELAGDQDAVTLLGAAAHAPAQLVQLSQAKT